MGSISKDGEALAGGIPGYHMLFEGQLKDIPPVIVVGMPFLGQLDH
jgi:hypothetical protein